MIVDPLNITKNVQFDNRISSIEVHTHNPYVNSSLNNNDEIRIPIQQQDLVVLLCDSYLYVEGKIVEDGRAQDAGPDEIVGTDNNCVAFMFDEIRYEINGVEIDRAKNVGMTSTLKNCVSMTRDYARVLSMAGWNIPDQLDNMDHDTFDFCVPLSHLMGFFEDYKRVLANVRHELVLVRSRNDSNALYGSKKIASPRIELSRVQWRVPHIGLDEYTKLQFLKILERDDPITLSFRSWDLYEYPMPQQTDRHTWTIKTSTQLEKPRYVIVAFADSKRMNTHTHRNCEFVSAGVTDVKLYLNSTFYPYDKLNVNFTSEGSKKYRMLYQMYAKFIESYYGHKNYSPLFDMTEFRTYGPFFVIDCSHQNESIKSGTVDVKLEIECKHPVPANTHAYCLILHDRVVEYSPLTNNVRKLI